MQGLNKVVSKLTGQTDAFRGGVEYWLRLPITWEIIASLESQWGWTISTLCCALLVVSTLGRVGCVGAVETGYNGELAKRKPNRFPSKPKPRFVFFFPTFNCLDKIYLVNLPENPGFSLMSTILPKGDMRSVWISSSSRELRMWLMALEDWYVNIISRMGSTASVTSSSGRSTMRDETILKMNFRGFGKLNSLREVIKRFRGFVQVERCFTKIKK